MEQTSNQGVLPASVEVAVLLGEEGRSNSQEARPALEEGEFDDMKSFCVFRMKRHAEITYGTVD